MADENQTSAPQVIEDLTIPKNESDNQKSTIPRYNFIASIIEDDIQPAAQTKSLDQIEQLIRTKCGLTYTTHDILLDIVRYLKQHEPKS